MSAQEYICIRITFIHYSFGCYMNQFSYVKSALWNPFKLYRKSEGLDIPVSDVSQKI